MKRMGNAFSLNTQTIVGQFIFPVGSVIFGASSDSFQCLNRLPTLLTLPLHLSYKNRGFAYDHNIGASLINIIYLLFSIPCVVKVPQNH